MSADRLPEWAVLIYSSASPDIQGEAVASLREVAAAAQSDQVVLGAQLGTAEGVARFRFTGETTDEMSRPPLEALPPRDMADPAALEDFMRWGMRSFPAKRYAVVLGGHGAGFLGAVGSADRRRLMPPGEMAEALRRSGVRPQVLVLNACLMAQAEVAREVAPCADWLVASQGLEHREGIPLGSFVERLGSLRTGAEAAAALVEESAGTPQRTPSMSAVDLSRMDGVAAALDGLGRALLARPDLVDALRSHIRALPHFREDRPEDRPLSEFKDLAAFARRIQADPSLSELAEPARKVEEAVEGAVLLATGAGEGLSAWLPTQPLSWTHGALGEKVEGDYRRLALSRATSWDEALDVLTGRAWGPDLTAPPAGAAGAGASPPR